jgi:medium-chain acyl-[acyl-carrier-protein] hydrolase
MPPLVDALAEAIIPYLDKPFAFFGHSMGAKIAFELARRLRNAYGLEPIHLFASGCRAPHIQNPEPPTYNLPEPEFIEELRTLNGTPKEVLEHPELMSLLLPLLRADFEMVQTYEYIPDKPLSTPITVYGGLRDEDITREQLEGWSQHTTSPAAVRMFMGGHFFLNSEQPLVLKLLSQQLYQIEENIGRHSR